MTFAPPPDSTNPQLEKLSFITKLSYGAGDMGAAITANLLAFFLLFFFTSAAGLSPALAGNVLAIGKVWDAVNDPMVGVLSDRTRSRWGRRLPWMFWGAVPFGLLFFLQWIVPRFSDNPVTNEWALFWYYVVISILFNSVYTAVNLPYTALTAELTQDYDERTSLNSFRFSFSLGGAILSLIIAQIIFNVLKDNVVQQYLVLGAVAAIASIIPTFCCVLGIRKRVLVLEQERIEPEVSESLPFFQQLKIAFSNRPFLYVIAIYLFSWMALQNTSAVIPYFVVNWMGLPQNAVTGVALALQGTALLLLFAWGAIAQRIGKRAAYFIGIGLWMIAQAGVFFVQPGQVGLMYFLAVVIGIGVSTAYLIPWSMMPDVIELDELRTGQRREGIFYGFMVLFQKIGLAIGVWLVGQMLGASGFVTTVPGQPEPTQPASALLTIRLLVGVLPLVFLAASLVFNYFYPITREVHAEILLKLRERKQVQ